MDCMALGILHVLSNILKQYLTFNKESSAHQLGELQAVECQNVVEDNGPEVDSIEQTTDPARHGFTHGTLWGSGERTFLDLVPII